MANDGRGYPKGDAQERVVFRRYMDVPSKNAPGSGGPARSAGMRPGVLTSHSAVGKAPLLVTFSLHKQRKVTRAPKVHESLCFCPVWVALKSHIDRASRAGECLYGRAPSIAPTRQRHRRRRPDLVRRHGRFARCSGPGIRCFADQQKTAPVARRRLSCLTPAAPVQAALRASIQRSTRCSSRSRGRAPPPSTVSWKPRMSNLSPSSLSALARSSSSLFMPIL